MIKNIKVFGRQEVIKTERKQNKDLEVIRKLKNLKKNNNEFILTIKFNYITLKQFMN